jgi:hypothetical protein
MDIRSLALGAGAMAAAVVVAGCTSSSKADPAPSPSGRYVVWVVPGYAPPPPPSLPPAPTPSACTVEDKTLEAAFTADAATAQAFSLDGGFTSITCVGGFARATAPPRNGDARIALFQRDDATGGWTVLAAGSGIDCAAYAPAATATALGC